MTHIYVIEALQDDDTWWPLPKASYPTRETAVAAMERKRKLVTRMLRVMAYVRAYA